MKYFLAWLAGVAIGVALLLAALYYNPFAGQPTVSPLVVAGQPLLDLSFSTVPSDAIAFTNDGESRIAPYPGKIQELWEPAIRKTSAFVTLLADSRGQTKGVGIKFSSDSEQTRLLYSEALRDSVWHVWLPDSGSLLVEQTENLWPYIRNIVVPARWNSADSWRGNWNGITTLGPSALGTARVFGGSGRYAGMTAEAIESISARAYSAIDGPVFITGNLSIAAVEYVADEPAAD